MRMYRSQISLIAIICLFLIFASCALPATFEIACAEDLTATNVLYDLQHDPNFNQGDYPVDSYNNSISLIQIAESDTKALYVYVYQPNYENAELNPYEITISTSQDGEDDAFKTYDLTLVNSYKTLFKFKVEDLTVNDEWVRYYNISQMSRKYIESIDSEIDNDNVIGSVGIEVAQRWGTRSIDDTVEYAMKKIDVVVITDAYVGTCKYSDGITWAGYVSMWDGATDSHYIAFTTDRRIDKLLEADVEFSYIKAYKRGGMWSSGTKYEGDWVEDTKYLDSTQTGGNEANGWFSKKHTWNRILTAADFLSDPDTEFKEDAIAKVQKHKWVLRFHETKRKSETVPLGGYTMEYWTEVKDVAILRLKFETDGVIYNLGVVSNKQTGTNIPDNENTGLEPDGILGGGILDGAANWLENTADKLTTAVIVIAAILAAVLIFWALFKLFSASKAKTSGVNIHVSNQSSKPKKKTGGKK